MPNQTRVLYVNDEPESLRTWADFLADHGELAVTTAASVSEGVGVIATNDIDCILSDLSTAEDRNLEFLEEVKKRDSMAPFFLFTEDEADKTINDAIKAGADDYISKSTAENGVLLRRIRQSASVTPTRVAKEGETKSTSIDIVEPGKTDETERIETESRQETTSQRGAAGGQNTSESGQNPISYDPARATSTLIQCKSDVKRKRASAVDVLENERSGEINVALVRYRRIDENALAEIAQRANRTTLISVGYNQSAPSRLENEIEIVQINSPTDLTRLGIVTTGIVEEWDSHPEDTILCFDTLNILLQYKSTKQVFQFLHILLAKLQSASVTSYFHIDHTAEEPQDVNSLKPIFDNILAVATERTRVESETR
ncbi:DUF7504 family protein [Halostagnicola bangensis]